MKRVMVATIFGLVVGGICATAAFSSNILPFTLGNVAWVLFNRAVMGFAIGASGLRLPWAWNGVLVGLVVGSVFSASLYRELGPSVLPLVNAAMNGVFGLLIAFLTERVLHWPAAAPASPIHPAATV
ncbi:MAG TPA: hypothetical protein VEA99_18765 [Gemmatimonadaceae bacterium]|nr:hypothetical protein [Gemmatimonadaceae bacterium]